MLALVAAFLLAPQEAPVKKVLVIGIDGCRADALSPARTPHLDELVSNGSYARAQADPLAMCGPGWATVLAGAWSDKHGVRDNTCLGANTKEYPDFLTVIERAKPSLRTVVVAEWAPVTQRLVQQADSKWHRTAAGDRAVALEAAAQIAGSEPDVLFVHFGAVDAAGHAHGFDPASREYLKAIEETDANIGTVLAALRGRKLAPSEDWLVIVTSDHGGHGTTHGVNQPSDTHVPFIVSGRSHAPSLFSPSNVDVAPTVFAHLGLSPLPDLDWDGVAVGLKGVSTGSLTAARDARLIKFAPEDGFLLKGERLRLANAESGTTIRYTLDGTLPTIASESGDSIEMERSGLLRARAFGPQGAVGPSSSIFVTVQEAPLRALPDRPTSPGLRFALVRGAVEDVRVADFGSPDRRGVIAAPTADLGERGPFAARFVGFVKIETPGVYRFGVAGTGDSALKVGGRTGFGLVSLEAGLHEFELTTVQPRGEGTLVLTISARGQRPREAMDSLFAH